MKIFIEICIVEGTAEAVAFGSGMAAITAVLLAAATRGRHVIAVRRLYGGSDHLLTSGLLGLEVSFVGANDVAAALRPDTALVFIETPGNPTLSLIDIEQVVRQSGTVPVAVDSTFATPVLQRPLAHGATYSIHSATKFLSGHGDVIAGVVATSAAAAAGLRQLASSPVRSSIPGRRTCCIGVYRPCRCGCAAPRRAPASSPRSSLPIPESRGCSTPASPAATRCDSSAGR